MTDADLINTALGLLLPAAVAVVQRPQWSDRQRLAASYICYLIAAIVSAWFLQQIDLGDGSPRAIVRAFLVIAVAAYGSFKLAWKPLGITPKIETAVNGGAK